MTTWQPIAKTVTQYVDNSGKPYSGAVLKAYIAGTTTVTDIATSSSGGTTVTSVALNASGYPVVSGVIIIPYISSDYKLSLYPSQTAANANSGALWTVDNIARDFAGVASLPSANMLSADQVVGYQGDVVKRLTVLTSSLSDTEEDVIWTPTLYGATTAGTTTYIVQSGTYNKIGNTVVLNFRLDWNALTGTGEARIGGLPYVAKNFSGTYRFGLVPTYYNSIALPADKTIGGYLQDNTNFIRLVKFGTTTANDFVDLQTEMTTSAEIYGSITYTV